MTSYTLRYKGISGRVWPIAAAGSNTGVVLRSKGLEGMVGEVDDEALSAHGVPGQVVDHQQVGPMTGSLAVAIYPTATESVAEVVSGWRSDWSRLVGREGLLELDSPTMGVLSTPVRLAASLPPVDDDPYGETSIEEAEAELVADGGVWSGPPQSGTGSVTVTNTGDVRVWPRIGWQAAGPVVLPSGASFLLPAVPAPRVLDLDPGESLEVTDAAGVLDRAVWEQVRGAVLPEGVPPGKSRTYILPAGASLRWRLGYLDPWR
ncbi:MAG: hypothetical protein Q4F65_05910 [Propionibacteriaceae bacterium]|nr:hypothetical protein [Propionibacteriaceae bacterium]